MDDVSMGRIERKSSIENEPLTLNIQQIQFAREAALHVVNTTSIEEALRIFTEGLEPIINRGSENIETMMDYSELDCAAHHSRIISPRDIATAPF